MRKRAEWWSLAAVVGGFNPGGADRLLIGRCPAADQQGEHQHAPGPMTHQEAIGKARIKSIACFTHTEAVANVPSRAAIAHPITAPQRRYGLQRPATKEGTYGALFSCSLAMPVRYTPRVAFCRGWKAAGRRLPLLEQRLGRPQGALSRLCGTAPALAHPRTQECKLAWGKWRHCIALEINLSPFSFQEISN